MGKNQGVVFRRVRGRIIPVHIREGGKDIIGGANIAATSGWAAAKMFDAPGGVRRLAKRAMLKEAGKQAHTVLRAPFEAGSQLSFTDNVLGALKKGPKPNPVGVFKRYQRLENAAKILPKLAVPVFLGGAALGGAYIARGIARVRNEKKPTLGTAVAQNIGDAGAFGLGGFFLLRTRGVGIRAAFKEVLNVTPAYLKKIKR